MTAAELDIIIGANTDEAVEAFKRLGYTINKTSDQAAKANKSFNSAGFALTNLGRVAQDAPFGFISIQNNLSPLLESFQQLQKETGSSGAALKALTGALSGPAGIGIALSAVSAIITFLQVGFSAWTRGLFDNKKEVEEGASALKVYTQEAENLKSKLEGLTSTLDSMQKLWNAQNKVRFFNDDAEAQLLEAKNNLGFVIADYNELTKAVEEAVTITDKALKAQSDIAAKAGEDSEEAKKAAEEYQKVLKIQFDLQDKQKAKLTELQQARSQRDLAELTFQKQAAEAAKKRAEELEKERKRLEELNKPLQDLNINIKGISSKFIDKIAVETGDHLGEIQKTLDGKPLEFKFKPPQGDFADMLKQIDGIINTVQSSFDALFNSVANGESVFRALGNAVKALVVKLVAAVVEAAILSLIINAIFPGASAAGNFSFGGLLSKLTGLPKFASGGVVTKPTLAIVGENGPERISPLGYNEAATTSLPERIVLAIRGQDLVTVLERNNNGRYNTF